MDGNEVELKKDQYSGGGACGKRPVVEVEPVKKKKNSAVEAEPVEISVVEAEPVEKSSVVEVELVKQNQWWWCILLASNKL